MGRIFTKKHRENLKRALKSKEYKQARAIEYVCGGCGNKKIGYSKLQVVCSQKCLIDKRRKDREVLQVENPFRYKAWCMSSNLRLGKDKLDIVEKMIRDALDTPCGYCGEKLVLGNLNIDHKKPLMGMGQSKGRETIPLAIRKILDAVTNLQIICKHCNNLKGEMNDLQFRNLLEFLDKDPALKKIIIARLGRSNIMWSFKRRAKS